MVGYNTHTSYYSINSVIRVKFHQVLFDNENFKLDLFLLRNCTGTSSKDTDYRELGEP